jgi:hypothetical protein
MRVSLPDARAGRENEKQGMFFTAFDGCSDGDVLFSLFLFTLVFCVSIVTVSPLEDYFLMGQQNHINIKCSIVVVKGREWKSVSVRERERFSFLQIP